MVLSLRKYLYRSLYLHAGLFALILISPFLPFKRYRFRQEKIVWVTLPKGVTNDWGSPMKKTEGLPKTTIQEQKKALESPPAGEKKPAMTYTPKPWQKQPAPPAKKPKRPGSADSRIEDALSRVQKQVAMKKAEPEAAQVPETRPGGFTFGTTTGPYVAPNDPEYVLYQAKIRQRIMQEWILPMKFAGEGASQEMGPEIRLICRIVVHMNERGEVVETEWDLKSGNPSFDMSAMRAVEKAAPLDIPPERLKYEVFNEGFIVEFRPQAVAP